MENYVKFNQDRWNNVSRKKGNPYTVPLTSEEYKEAIENELSVGLTVGKTVPTECGWATLDRTGFLRT